MPQPILRIGLTGGIGSGKSTVARVLVASGAMLIDADAISRQVTAPGGAALQEIARQFGDDLITADGAMDRDRMRQLAFGDPSLRRRLEAIIHPLVSQEVMRQSESAAAAAKDKGGCIVFDVPLLVESGRWRQQVDHVLVVDCMETTQIARVMARNGWSQEAVEKIMAGQAGRAQRLAAADSCLFNDGLSRDALAVLVRQLGFHFGL
jgi:dephospho-CoA kinase